MTLGRSARSASLLAGGTSQSVTKTNRCARILAVVRRSLTLGRGEYARDEDGDGFCEVHVNTMEGFRSLPRFWLRPHRGISQEKLPPLPELDRLDNVANTTFEW